MLSRVVKIFKLPPGESGTTDDLAQECARRGDRWFSHEGRLYEVTSCDGRYRQGTLKHLLATGPSLNPACPYGDPRCRRHTVPRVTKGNPHGYRLSKAGEPMCDHCGRVTNRAYLPVPELRCWNCGKELARAPKGEQK
jgi:hypothetical protein